VERLAGTGVIFFALAAYFTWQWWKHRRNGRMKKAAKALGAKSKARVEALVRQMTRSPIPSPVGAAGALAGMVRP
jgi:predicted negative regulator of RcsB-dependent stress response